MYSIVSSSRPRKFFRLSFSITISLLGDIFSFAAPTQTFFKMPGYGLCYLPPAPQSGETLPTRRKKILLKNPKQKNLDAKNARIFTANAKKKGKAAAFHFFLSVKVFGKRRAKILVESPPKLAQRRKQLAAHSPRRECAQSAWPRPRQ